MKLLKRFGLEAPIKKRATDGMPLGDVHVG